MPRGNLYAATVADFSGTDSLIIKNQLRTEQYDYRHLNAPDFVSSLEDEDHVYFFFREAAVEHMNCGKAIFSRVARVCKNDEGGSHKFSNRWTTFLKSRLNCSLPGDYPFYFNNIQSTSGWHREAGQQVFYAVFTTPANSIPGSAICRSVLLLGSPLTPHGPGSLWMT
jgi:semaphorin 6